IAIEDGVVGEVDDTHSAATEHLRELVAVHQPLPDHPVQVMAESSCVAGDNSSKIRTILKEHGRLSKDAVTLPDEADLYQAGMTSHASVNVMLALEGEFDVEFPDHMLKRSVFESIAAIHTAIDELVTAK